ncbi:MAG: phosphoribosylanthranilate isomerase [Acidimicrobiales bacterium]
MGDPIGRGFIKVCGVTSVADAQAIVAAGASAIGLNFATSPRRIDRDRAREIIDSIDGALLCVAVFRGQSDETIRDLIDDLAIDAVQLHDSLSDELLATLGQRSLTVIRAIDVTSDEVHSIDEQRVDAVLLDGPSPGSGREHAWGNMTSRSFTVPLIAAGGLSPDNVANTIAETRVAGVDSASALESAPGKKDYERVKSFVENAKRAFSRLEE